MVSILPFLPVHVSDALTRALNAISVSTELVEEELKPHMDTLLNVLLEKSESTYSYPSIHSSIQP